MFQRKKNSFSRQKYKHVIKLQRSEILQKSLRNFQNILCNNFLVCFYTTVVTLIFLGFRKFNHKLDPLSEMNRKRQFTKTLWKKLYPKDPFDLPDEKSIILKQFRKVLDSGNPASTRQTDIINTVFKHLAFYYQVRNKQ